MPLAALILATVIQTPDASQTAMRRAPVTFSSDRSQIELQTCVTRYWAQAGTITPIPLADGVTLDFYTRGVFGPGKARLSFTIQDDGQKRTLGVTYRHPLSAKSAARALTPAIKMCSPESIRAEAES